MQLFRRTAHELHDLLVKKEVSAVEIHSAVFERIDAVEDKIGAFITKTKADALKAAQATDEKLAQGGQIAALAGIPVALKDNLCQKGVLATAASKMLENFVAPYDATVVEKLASSGAALVGKTNLDEFAMGSSTETSFYGPTRNPWNLERVPGGSSGGSAAAVSAGEAVCALGTDTGGSLRQPAALCGVVGLKPTYGLVSRYGVIPLATSLDQAGPLTKDVTDCALLLAAISGHDPRDSTSAPYPAFDAAGVLVNDVRGLKIGIPEEYLALVTAPAVKTALEDAAKLLETLGATVEYVSLPHSQYAATAFSFIAAAEASSNMARIDGVRYGFQASDAVDVYDMFSKSRAAGFGPEVKRRVMLGTYALSAGCYDVYYLKAMKTRTLIKQDFDQALARFDLLLTPTTPAPAFPLGEKAGDPLGLYQADCCTQAVNLAGLPAISVPCGLADGLPIGLQLIGRYFDEKTLLRAAYTFEQNTAFHQMFPEI